MIGEEPSSKPSKKSKALPKDPKTRKSSLKPDYDGEQQSFEENPSDGKMRLTCGAAKQRTAEAYMVHAMMK